VSGQPYTLIVEAVEVQGACPVYGPGDRFRIEQGYRLVSDRPVCMHALQSIVPYYVALRHGVPAVALGLAGADEGAAYVQCLDAASYTGGGTVTFKIAPMES